MLTEERETHHAADAPAGASVFLALGGNLGDREAVFRAALASLRENGFAVDAVSGLYENAAVGCEEGAPPFYNAVAHGFWNGTPETLLALCRRLEAAAGRPADHPHWHSRTLDLDLILFDGRILNTEDLVIPHPLAHKRLFVMRPLAEIAPGAVFPTLNKTASAILDSLGDDGSGMRFVKEITL